MNPSCATRISLCPCESSHLEPLCLHTNKYIYIYVFQSIHILCYRYFRIWTHVVRTHICFLPCQSTLWSSLYTNTYLQICICHSIDTRVRIWTLDVQIHICFCSSECSQIEPLCIHQYFYKCTYFLSSMRLYMNRCGANLRMCVCVLSPHT